MYNDRKRRGHQPILGQVIVARAETSRSVTGIVDGLSSRAIESEDDKQNRSKLLRDLGYKKMTRTCRFATRRPVREGRVSSAHLTIRPVSSVQPELAVDRADLGRL